MLKKQGAKSRSKLRVSIQHLNFNQSNVAATRVDMRNREFGFVKTTKRQTTFAKSGYVDNVYSLSSESSDSSLRNLQIKDVPQEMSFEMKRKLFHEGEFTITRGKKTSEMHHPNILYTLPNKPTYDSDAEAFKEMEEFVSAMDIEISNAYE